MSRKQLIELGAKLAISALLLCLVLSRVHVAGILSQFRTIDVKWLVPLLLLGPIVVLLTARRWQLLSLGLLDLGESVRYTWIGLFFGSIVPGVVGGDVAKGVSLAAKKAGARDTRLPISIVVDKLLGFWVLLLGFNAVALGFLLLKPALFADIRGILWATAAAAAAGLIGAAAMCNAHVGTRIRSVAMRLPSGVLRDGTLRALSAVASYNGHGNVLVRAALLSAVIHTLNAASLWMTMQSLAVPASFWFAAIFYPMLSVLLALPVSISGVGVRDVFSAGIFTAFGLNPESGVAFSWLLLALSIPNVLVGGSIQLWELFHRQSAP